ncbi:hypothetical protein KKA69_01745, partial [Patescibacteria group bacterium]|nr:hypothetical protein [Patescibacteria group bacterium]
YYKKIFSGQAEKLSDNQDLIELTNEQMEILYRRPGVKFALEWYAKAIVASGNGKYQVGGRSIYGCETGSDFEEIRAKLRSRIARHLGIDKPESDMSVNEITQVKAVDAIAWNWIFCSNLVESADSRYSFSGDRHGNLASEIVSDDLRAVFHPQEKFEDKCRNSQAWGNFGKWGLTQVNRIKDFYISSHPGRKVNYIFAPAKRISDFWKDEIHGDVVTIYAPECYPTTSMKSFWEVYSSEVEGSSDSSATLLSRLLKGENINWRTVQGDPWKTNYLTVKLRKANALFDHFTKESKPGWVRSLLDIYTRLLTKSILREYYSRELSSRGVLGSEQNKEAERLAGIHLHNLKVWADYAVQGGVGMPQNRLVTDPYSTSETGQSIGWHRTSHEHVLRKPQHGYLDKKESLTIESIV